MSLYSRLVIPAEPAGTRRRSRIDVLKRCCVGRGSYKGSVLLCNPHRADFSFVRTPIPEYRVGVRRRERHRKRANRTAAGPQGPEAETEEAEDRRPCRLASKTWRMHACIHRYPEEAELGPSEGDTCPPVIRSRDHRLHPWRRSQPPGTLDRSRPWWTFEGSSGCSLQSHSWSTRRRWR